MGRITQIIIGALIVIILLLIGIKLWGAATGSSTKSGPKLTISAPAEGAQVQGDKVTIRGATQSGAKVKVNNQDAKVAKDGSFQAAVPLDSEQNFIFVKSTYKGHETIVQRSVTKVAAATGGNLSDQGETKAQAPAAQPKTGAQSQLGTTGPVETSLMLAAALVATLAYTLRRRAR